MKKKYILLILSAIMSVFFMFSCKGNSDSGEIPTDPDGQKPSDKISVIDISDYGAATGADDNAAAITEVIAAAGKADKPITINFPKREYHIYPDKSPERELYISNTVGIDPTYKMKRIGFLFENMQDVTLEGNGSKFIFHGKMTAFAAIDCKNITLQNFSVDFAVPTVIDITVETLGETDSKPHAVYSVPDCYNYEIEGNSINWLSDISPYSNERYWRINGVTDYAQVRYKRGETIRIGNAPILKDVNQIVNLSKGRIKVVYNNRDTDIKEGNCYQMRETTRDHAGMFFWQSAGVTLKNINSYYLHGFGIVGQYSQDITLEKVNFVSPEDSGRHSAGYADFIQMSGCKGLVKIIDCEFDNPHDDPINIHGTFLQITDKIAYNKFKVRFMHNESGGFPAFYCGDRIEFVARNSLNSEFSAVITAVEKVNLSESIITVDKTVPSKVGANTHVVENVTYTPQVEITGCNFAAIPTRGILVTSRAPILIENNTFYKVNMACIYVSADADVWYESGAVKDLTIKNNTFSDCGSTAILIDPTNSTVEADIPVHRNITIEKNTFNLADYAALQAKSTYGIKFSNNTLMKLNKGASPYKTPLFLFNGCLNAELFDNIYGEGLNLTVKLMNMPYNYISIKDDNLRIEQ